MVIQWTTPATEELLAAYEYVAADNPAAAQRIINYIWETVGVLARHPLAGRKGRVAGTRELVIAGTPFVVAYKVEKDEVWILAVLTLRGNGRRCSSESPLIYVSAQAPRGSG